MVLKTMVMKLGRRRKVRGNAAELIFLRLWVPSPPPVCWWTGKTILCHFTVKGSPSLWLTSPLLGAFEYIFYVTSFRNSAFLQISLFDRADFVLSSTCSMQTKLRVFDRSLRHLSLYPIGVQHLMFQTAFVNGTTQPSPFGSTVPWRHWIDSHSNQLLRFTSLNLSGYCIYHLLCLSYQNSPFCPQSVLVFRMVLTIKYCPPQNDFPVRICSEDKNWIFKG
jgi:hypothetical protein